MTANMTDHDWLQIEQCAICGITGPLKDWPDLEVAIEKLTGKPIRHYSADLLRGFCIGAVAARREVK